MTWSETHRRWQALQEIEALANASSGPELPWNTEYADIFGSPEGLLDALRYRWNLTRNAQLDSHLTEALLDEQHGRLAARNHGVLRLLRSYDDGSVTVTSTVEPVAFDEDERVPA